MPQYLGSAGRNSTTSSLMVSDGRLRRAALDDDDVVAGELHLGRERAAHVAVVEDARHRALAAHDEARRRADVGAGERAGDEEHGVVLGPGVETRRDLLPHVAQQQALAADVALGPLHVERLDGGGARAQVDPEHLALVEVHCVLLKTCDRNRHGSPPADRGGSSRGPRRTWEYRLCHSSRRSPGAATPRKRRNAGQKGAERRASAWPLWRAGARRGRTGVRRMAAKGSLARGRVGTARRLRSRRRAARPRRSRRPRPPAMRAA